MSKIGYTVDFVNGVVTLTAAFTKAAQNPNSSEYKTLKKLRNDYPDMIIARRAGAKHKTSVRQLRYDKMVKYLSCQPNATQLLLDFNSVRDFSTSQPKPYEYVKQWFFSRFPEYGKLPTFDSVGSPESQRVLPDMKAA